LIDSVRRVFSLMLVRSVRIWLSWLDLVQWGSGCAWIGDLDCVVLFDCGWQVPWWFVWLGTARLLWFERLMFVTEFEVACGLGVIVGRLVLGVVWFRLFVIWQFCFDSDAWNWCEDWVIFCVPVNCCYDVFTDEFLAVCACQIVCFAGVIYSVRILILGFVKEAKKNWWLWIEKKGSVCYIFWIWIDE